MPILTLQVPFLPSWPNTPAISAASINNAPINNAQVALAPKLQLNQTPRGTNTYLGFSIYLPQTTRVDDICEIYIDPVGAPPSTTPVISHALTLQFLTDLTNANFSYFGIEVLNHPIRPGDFEVTLLFKNASGRITAVCFPHLFIIS
ncbi:hypothetical protein ACKJSM_03385 [Pseudomonas sp. PHC1]|uniref:hypothetical protein n=1 Tax=Pseudomonas sp. PHC1 TaxID=3384759 RepID=UPI00396F4E32